MWESVLEPTVVASRVAWQDSQRKASGPTLVQPRIAQAWGERLGGLPNHQRVRKVRRRRKRSEASKGRQRWRPSATPPVGGGVAGWGVEGVEGKGDAKFMLAGEFEAIVARKMLWI